MPFPYVRRTRNLYSPNDTKPFTISRSKIDLFLDCARCFYLDVRYGVGRPPSFPFNLNNAVDELLKREYDHYRAQQKPHPLFKKYGVDAIPLAHEQLDEWRDALRRGIKYEATDINLIVRGGIDDVWQAKDGSLYIVDYKATSKKEEVSLDAEWQIGYKRQMEIYQWLFAQNGFTVNPIGYFVYVNADATRNSFDENLHFTTKIIPYEGNTKWIPNVLHTLKETLDADTIPPVGTDCSFCPYRTHAGTTLLSLHTATHTETSAVSNKKEKSTKKSVVKKPHTGDNMDTLF